MVSALIFTKDEEKNLPECLEALEWCEDIHVVDSYSDDRTAAIAEANGATLTRRRFTDWASHQNWAVENVPFKNDWILYVDADERVTAELARSVLAAVRNPGNNVAFRFRRRDFLGEKWLKHVQLQHWSLRLFRREVIRYERLVHCVPTIAGNIGVIDGILNHYPFSKGYTNWLDRHNRYSTFEARQTLIDEAAAVDHSDWRALVGKDIYKRRYYQKLLFYRLPFRPAVKFLLLYFMWGGFMDGAAGFKYAALQAIYEYFIVLKTLEMRLKIASRDIGQLHQIKGGGESRIGSE